jgi:hypothetical protein
MMGWRTTEPIGRLTVSSALCHVLQAFHHCTKRLAAFSAHDAAERRQCSTLPFREIARMRSADQFHKSKYLSVMIWPNLLAGDWLKLR